MVTSGERIAHSESRPIRETREVLGNPQKAAGRNTPVRLGFPVSELAPVGASIASKCINGWV
jgi:hypothetical protein